MGKNVTDKLLSGFSSYSGETAIKESGLSQSPLFLNHLKPIG